MKLPKPPRTLLAALLLVPLAALGPGPAPATAAAAGSADVEVFATGLVYPRGLEFGPDGHLYVSEHGYGGDPAAGRILRIRVG
jgi:glucose/arabinose dehydrogenase